MNQIQLYGRLGAMPERTKNGGAVKLSLATNDGYGEKQKTNWHNVVCFGKTADAVEKYLKKGDGVIVLGSVDYSEYEKDGQKRYYTAILCNRVEFVEKKSAGDGKGSANFGGANAQEFDDFCNQTPDSFSDF